MNLKPIICYLFFLVCSIDTVFAQDIKLKDISKIELVSSSPFWVGPLLKVLEVLPENGKWNVYHLRSQLPPKHERDSVRRFLKTIPEKSLRQLLDYINDPDTVIRLKKFKTPKDLLKREIDSLQKYAKGSLRFRHDKLDSLTANITAEQKAYYIKMTDSKQAVNDATLKALNPLFNDDRSYFTIVFFYKNQRTDTVSAYVNDSHLYHLPWTLKNKENYNPHLSEVFESISGDTYFGIKEMKRLVFDIAWELNYRWVLTRSIWEDYKIHYPANYQLLSKTLKPVYFYSAQSGYFKSSLLPSNLQLRFGFMPGDTLKTDHYNTIEKQVVKSYQKGNFFFDYLKVHPMATVSFSTIPLKTVEEIKANYPAITNYDYHDIKHVSMSFSYYQTWIPRKTSGWLLLPDGKMILLFCSDALIQEGDKIFAGLKPAGWNKHRNYCIVYDAKGNKIAGGEIPVKIDIN